ncbi:MAG: glucose-1-phosphate thymidylyltransferase [Dehalococcoidia bacterium]
MKGVVLAGGKGSRLRPFTYSGAKQLVPIANTPVLHFPIRQLVEAGITEIAIIVGDAEGQIREAMGDGRAFGARLTYIRQAEPLGIAHAVAVAQDFVGSDRFVVYLGDNVLHGGIGEFVRAFAEGGATASIVLREVEDPRAFGVAEMAQERLVRVLEKPEDPPTNLAVIGVYAFTPAVFEVIREQSPSARGELEIADSINGLLARGLEVQTMVTREYWIDTGKMEDMLQANRVVLASLHAEVHPSARVLGSTLDDPVVVGEGAVVERCELIGPVIVGARARVRDCRLGPDVAVGEGCDLSRVNVSNSIIMSDTTMRDCPGVLDSMIGRFARVSGAPAGSKLTLGDHSCLEVGP